MTGETTIRVRYAETDRMGLVHHANYLVYFEQARTELLRSCGAHEAYLRTHRGSASDERAAGFLLLDRLFPRSIVFALGQAEACLAALDPVSDRTGLDEARRHLGLARTRLEYRPLLEVLDSLPDEMESVQRACSAASDAIRMRYFPSGHLTNWVGEAL